MKTIQERNRILNEVRDKCYLAFFDGNPEEGGKEILTGRKKVNFPVATLGYVASTNQLDFTGGEEDIVMKGKTEQQTYTGKNLIGFEPFTETEYGITVTADSDGVITINGTRDGSTGAINFGLSTLFNIPEGNITITVIPISGSFSGANIGYVARSSAGQLWYQAYTANGSYSQGTRTVTSQQLSLLDNIKVLVGSGASVFDNFKFKLQVTAGSNHDTDYEPYVGGVPSPNPDYPQDVQNITIGNLELCKIGDYQDYIYTENGKWYKHSEIGKLVLTGSEEGWGFDGTYNVANISRSTTDFPDFGIPDGGTNYVVNSFTPSSKGVSGSGSGSAIVSSSQFYFLTNYNSLADFKAWLASNNIELYAPLVASTDTEITDQTTLQMLEDLFGNTTGVAKYWGIYNSEIGGTLLYYFILPYEVRIVKDSTITIKAGNCVLKEG